MKTTAVQQDLSGWAERLLVVPGVVAASFLTDDGLRAGGSSTLPRDAQDNVAAMSSGLHSTALAAYRAITQQRDAAPVRLAQITVETDDGFLILMAAGDHTTLVVLTSDSADIGNVAFEMFSLIGKLGKAFASQAREDQ